MKTLTNQQKEAAIHRLEPIARLATVQEVNWLIRPSVWAFLLYWWANKWITISAYLNMPLSCIADWVQRTIMNDPEEEILFRGDDLSTWLEKQRCMSYLCSIGTEAPAYNLAGEYMRIFPSDVAKLLRAQMI